MRRRSLLAAAAAFAVGSGVYATRQYEVTASAERFDYGLRLNELGTDERESTVDLAAFVPSVRETLRDAAAVPGAAGANGLTPTAADRLRDAEYLRIDGTNYTTYVSDVRDVPLVPAARVVEPTRAPFDPARVALSIRNDGDDPLSVSDGPPLPFGVLSMHRAGDREARRTLWSDAYRDAGPVSTVGRRVLAVNGLAVGTTLGPGAAAETTYALGRGTPGEWVVETSVSVPGDGDGSEGHDGGDFPLRFRFRVE
jgi:hypothetical protein